jgi:uncharacterized SAM-binding protein YcdF (DUF218 family)
MVLPVYVYLSKILPLFVMPISVVLILLVVAFLFFQRDRKSTGGSLLLVAVIVLWMTSTPIVATTLYRDLEARYPPLPLAKLPVGDCLVLLGGAVGPAMPPRVDIELNEAVDRVYKAAQVHRAGRAKFVIVTAGNQPWSESPWAEADLLRDLLMEWGVPKDAIFLEGSSRNTRENALYSKIMIESMHCGTTLRVTSAAHMPRAVAAFQSVGVSVVAVSTDVQVVQQGTLSAVALLPSADALAMTSEAIREWIGMWMYRLQGWS